MSKFNEALFRIVTARNSGSNINILDVENIARDLDHFTEIELIDVAGESIVIAAKCPQIKTRVAIKVMLPVVPEKRSWRDKYRKKAKESVAECQRRFVRSISMQRLVRAILEEEQLENICYIPLVFREIYKTISGVSCFAYVMEYISNTPLIRWCESRTSDLDILKLFGNMVLGIMHCFHSRSIIHTDLKVDNILVSSDRPCFIDFGFAKNLSCENKITTYKTIEMHSGVFSTQSQIEYPTLRGYYEDVNASTLILWCMLNRQNPLSYDYKNNPKEVIFPAQMLPNEWRQFFLACTDEERKPFATIVDMYNEFDRIYKDYRAIVVKGNTIGPINKDEAMKHVYPQNKRIAGAFIDLLNVFGGSQDE